MITASPFYIYISNQPVAGTKSSSKSSSSSGNDGGSTFKWGKESGKAVKNGQFLSKYIMTRVFESGAHTIERAISESIQSIGYLSGDYIKETHWEEAQSLCQKISNIAVTAGVAAATGHFVVAGIDIVVSSINIGIDSFNQNRKNQALVDGENYNGEQLSKRAGLSSTRDGSRGTEN